jgi:peptidoglycan-N-acetylglucosamine deacetylase
MTQPIAIVLCAMLLIGCQPASHNADPVASGKRIALTYDDAPLGAGPRYSGPERTQAFLDNLTRAQSGPVAIFVTTQGLTQDDGAARIHQYAAAGHLIANHSHSHVWASRTETDAYIQDIDRAEADLAVFDNRRPWFRFPFLDEGGMGAENQDGTKRDALRMALSERGLISGYVTVDTYDWHLDRLWSQAVRDGKTVDMSALSEVYIDLVRDAANHYDELAQTVLQRQPAQVLLLHENDLAASFTADLIDALRADGWQIIHPDTAFSDPLVAQIPETLFSGMGRISALAADQGMRSRDVLDHWSVSEQAINQRVTQSGTFSAPPDPSAETKAPGPN